jgi:hypothetical protein
VYIGYTNAGKKNQGDELRMKAGISRFQDGGSRRNWDEDPKDTCYASLESGSYAVCSIFRNTRVRHRRPRIRRNGRGGSRNRQGGKFAH